MDGVRRLHLEICKGLISLGSCARTQHLGLLSGILQVRGGSLQGVSGLQSSGRLDLARLNQLTLQLTDLQEDGVEMRKGGD